MIHTTHVLFAILLILLAGNSLHVSIFPESILFASFGSLLPDIDHPSSYINRKSWRFIWLSGVVNSHRGWTHSIFGAAIITFVFGLILKYYSLNFGYIISFFLGYISHLISDSLNPSRVPWLWPKKKRYGINLIGVGSGREVLIQFLLIGLILVLSCNLYRNYINILIRKT